MWAKPQPDGSLQLGFEGRLETATIAKLWHKTDHVINKTKFTKITIKADSVTYCDGSGVGLFFDIILRGQRRGFDVTIEGLAPEYKKLLDMFESDHFVADADKIHPPNITEQVGQLTVSTIHDVYLQIAFFGRVVAATLQTFLHPGRIRFKDVVINAENAGANAVGIILLIGFLFGLILAFSSAMPLRDYGADIYVADLVAMSLIRVIGPFVTAIILAGRTGSAFAAELGTMRINEEVDALETMGLDPVRFLVVPKVLVTIFVAPLLTILTNIAGLIGSAVVVLSLGFGMVTYTEHVKDAIDSGDIFAGLFKALVYGGLIGMVGCFRGLQTESGASAVGNSTTRAVVNSIILVVIAEGIFAVLYYCLDI